MTRAPILACNVLRPISRVLIVWIAVVWSMLAGASDARQVFSGATHGWLRAVGKLQVPGQRYHEGRRSHYLEDCSATLVARAGRSHADIIITAWHCLEWYGDLSRPITFTVVDTSGEPLHREAYRLADGGGMHADWAILRLDNALQRSQVAALAIHAEAADPGQPIIMAGFSKDDGVGELGMALTFDPACAITAQGREMGDTDCTAFKGASGGAVVQLSENGEPRICGVISQGNGEGRSTFVPVGRFRSALNRHMD
ncbi:MAG: trypsin-like peptidase domain-containing protein [Halioglobus sp.]|nr:trypsin-like peptidase domain-containing protein [Halioglobus sp.]